MLSRIRVPADRDRKEAEETWKASSFVVIILQPSMKAKWKKLAVCRGDSPEGATWRCVIIEAAASDRLSIADAWSRTLAAYISPRCQACCVVCGERLGVGGVGVGVGHLISSGRNHIVTFSFDGAVADFRCDAVSL